MTPTEKRMQLLEDNYTYPNLPDIEPLALALCEIARQLERIAQCLEKLEPKI